jgi:peptidoglycan/LPS O-acetylase OafA/YrhL
MKAPSTQNARFAALDVMRGFAALFVACLHIRETAWTGESTFWHGHPHAWWSVDGLLALLSVPIMYGSFGVSAFFVISGYCIHRAHAARLARDGQYRVDARRFWFRRFVRIYPVLFAALCVTWACDAASTHFVPDFYKLGDASVTSFAMNLTALVGLLAHPFGSNGALWTLSIEIQFYAVYPVLFALRRRIGMGWMLTGALLVMVVSACVLDRHGLTCFTSYEFSWLLGAWVAERDVGVAWKATPGRWGQVVRGWFDMAPFGVDAQRLLGAGSLLVGCVAFGFSQFVSFQLWALGVAWLLPALFDLLPRWSGRRVFALFSKLGQISYSLYAIHLPIGVLATCALLSGHKSESLFPTFGFVLVAIGCAYVFHLVCERPFVRYLARHPDNAPGASKVSATASALHADTSQ